MFGMLTLLQRFYSERMVFVSFVESRHRFFEKKTAHPTLRYITSNALQTTAKIRSKMRSHCAQIVTEIFISVSSIEAASDDEARRRCNATFGCESC
ncbi:hypothetical protein WK62_21265 [Burkholderia ubonensis]|nr:hypothetical protein WK62_21265 [Burkholderia ubonensis]